MEQRREWVIEDGVIDAMVAFSDRLSQILGPNLLSVVLFGSAVLGDFRPGEGDIDFVAVTRAGLTTKECEMIFDLHDIMRSGEMGPLAVQIEGSYYPLAIVDDPLSATASGCYVGTSRKGWKPVDSNKNSMADYSIIRNHAITCYGPDIRHLFYDPSRKELLAEIAHGLDKGIEAAADRKDIAYALSMIHWAPRALYYADAGTMVSKKRGAEWFASQFSDNRWSALVTHAKRFRRYPLTSDDLSRVNPAVVDELQGFLVDMRELFLSKV